MFLVTTLSFFMLARPGGKGPAYKDAEDYYDEIIELKQVCQSFWSFEIIIFETIL